MKMKIVFLSNYFNHHQKPLSDALFEMCDDYLFIATGKMSDERAALGYKHLSAPYVKEISDDPSDTGSVISLINNADVVIAGSAPEFLLKDRKKEGKLIFRYSERPVKGNREPAKYLPRLIKWSLKNPRKKPIYLLGASAYAAYEYGRFFLFREKAFKWGYFTEAEIYPDGFETPLREKKPNSILWVARMLALKHPESAIAVAERLKKEGYSFTLEMVGDGVLRPEIEKMISEKNLEKEVVLRGAMSPEDVRLSMRKSEVFLFTSDKNEGWGAVLNEAMNSGCAVVASHEIGAAPFLIKNGENGIIYKDGDFEDLFSKTKKLFDDKELCRNIGRKAYETMVGEWSPRIAAERLISVSEDILSGGKGMGLYGSGPCSKAEILKDDWFKV